MNDSRRYPTDTQAIINDIKYEEFSHIKTNRQKTQTPKKSAGWCAGCDSNHMTGFEKCQVCGTRNRNFTLKKEPTDG